jgi:hypothetical protein
MQIPTHIFSGWCIANCLPLTARERFCCVLAATLPDLDGLPILYSKNAYYTYHHALCHNFFGILLSSLLTAFCRKKVLMFVCCLALFNLHIVMDLLGSGLGWQIYYFWPLTTTGYEIPWAWDFLSWQNYLCMGLLLAWTLWILRAKQCSPLEYCFPYADKIFVRMLAKKAR